MIRAMKRKDIGKENYYRGTIQSVISSEVYRVSIVGAVQVLFKNSQVNTEKEKLQRGPCPIRY